MENNNKPPKGKTKMGKESSFGLMEIKKDMTTKGHLCLWTTSWTRGKVQFSSVVSDSLQPHRLQHARPACPSPTHGVYSNSSQLSQCCHPTISSSVVPFSTHPQPFPASFQMSQLFASGGQSIGVSASISVLPVNIQD